MMSELVEQLRKRLREQMNEYADAMARGEMQTFDKYREAVGVITGLAIAERELLDLQKSLENDQDD